LPSASTKSVLQTGICPTITYFTSQNGLQASLTAVRFVDWQVLKLIHLALAAPVRINTPGRSKMTKKLYYGKYKMSILKVQVVISFLGEIVFGSFPHLVNVLTSFFIIDLCER
jgi:hypothetical protein